MSRALGTFAIAIAVVGLVGHSSHANAEERAPAKAKVVQASYVHKWGIAPVSARLAANGYLVHFRYRVVDEARAKSLFHDGIKPYLVDHASGQKLPMPSDTKLGGLRSSPRTAPKAGQLYYVLFANPVKAVQKGSQIDVVLGPCRMNGLDVQ